MGNNDYFKNGIPGFIGGGGLPNTPSTPTPSDIRPPPMPAMPAEMPVPMGRPANQPKTGGR